MMTETQEFLEQLKDPLRFGIRKACFEFYNTYPNHIEIYDLRISQVNEMNYYYVELIADDANKHIGFTHELLDILEEYTPANTKVSYRSVQELPTGKYSRTFYVYDPAHSGADEQTF